MGAGGRHVDLVPSYQARACPGQLWTPRKGPRPACCAVAAEARGAQVHVRLAVLALEMKFLYTPPGALRRPRAQVPAKTPYRHGLGMGGAPGASIVARVHLGHTDFSATARASAVPTDHDTHLPRGITCALCIRMHGELRAAAAHSEVQSSACGGASN